MKSIAGIDLDSTDAMTASLCRMVRLKSFAMNAEVEHWRCEIEPALADAARVADDGAMLTLVHCNVGIDATALGEGAVARRHFEIARKGGAGRRQFRAMETGAAALERVLAGDFGGAVERLRPAGQATRGEYPARLHLASAQLALGIFSGDDARLASAVDDDLLEWGLAHEMNLAAGMVGGLHAWALAESGRDENAGDWLQRIAPLVTDRKSVV